MLFRYKVEKCGYDSIEYAFHGPGVGYKVTIQYYKPSSRLFKWRSFKNTRLCYVMNALGHDTENIDINGGLFYVLKQYENIGEIMFKYIKKIIEEENYQKHVDNIATDIGKFVVTQGWNTIEIKENE